MPDFETHLGVRVPRPATLKVYGLTLEAWTRLVEDCPVQADGDAGCMICGKLPPSRVLVIDHEHVRGWKQMPPEQRKKYVRGLLGHTCNHYILSRYATVKILELAATYLQRYEDRKHGR